MLIAGINMSVLVLAGKPVPDLAAWIFFAGMAIVIVTALFTKRR